MLKSSKPKLIRMIQSVGITTFVEYYYLFKSQQNERNNDLIFDEFRKNKEPWKENSYKTKSSQGKSIFIHGFEKQALEFVINEANINKIGIKTKELAISIYNTEFK